MLLTISTALYVVTVMNTRLQTLLFIMIIAPLINFGRFALRNGIRRQGPEKGVKCGMLVLNARNFAPKLIIASLGPSISRRMGSRNDRYGRVPLYRQEAVSRR